MTPTGYRFGRSPVHRLPAGLKLLALVAAGVTSAILREPWTVAVLLVLVVAGYLVAGLPMRVMARQARPLAWLLAAIGISHLLLSGVERAVVVVGGIIALVLLAGLVTLTTPMSALVDTVIRVLRPLRRLGVDPERVALLLAITVRAVPVISSLAAEIREAQLARGLRPGPMVFAVPFIIRSLRYADQLGEALVARGVDT